MVKSTRGFLDITAMRRYKVQPTGFIAVLLRLSVDEFSAVEEAATHNGESVQQYIRDALGLRLYKEKREAYREDQM
jgi:hypothetical protein